MTYNFEKFTNFNSRSSEAYATITNNSSINFSSGFGSSNSISKYKYAVLYYDKKAKTIGVKFTDSNDEMSRFKVGKKGKTAGVGIIAHSFFKVNKIDMNKIEKTKYTPKKVSLRSVGIDEPGSMFIINLTEN